MSANPAINDSDFIALQTLDLDQLDAIMGGEGWGQWAGKYIGTTVGGGLGTLGGAALGSAVAPGAGTVIGGGAGGSLGAALGYDYGGRLGNWLTGGRQLVRAAVEKYATIGFCGGTGGCVIAAVVNGSPLMFPLVAGVVVGTLTGATYGLLRARFAR